MKKIESEKKNDNQVWLSRLTGQFNSFEAFQEFAAGQNPEDVANNFISLNNIDISNIIDKFDEEDKDTLDQLQKLTECEWHVFRIIKNKLNFRNKVKYVDFTKREKK